MILWFQEKVDVLESHEQTIHSVSSEYRAPAVLKMKKYIRPKLHRKVRLSRENIFIRDNYECQYCGQSFPYRQLTLDHINPVSRGGGKYWENLVAACHSCNHKKSNRTPREARMPLKKKPVPLRWTPALDVRLRISAQHELWSPYLNIMQGSA